jgi:hypothetical protein
VGVSLGLTYHSPRQRTSKRARGCRTPGIVMRARRSRTGSKYVTFRGRLRRAIPFLLVGPGVGRNRNSIWGETVLPTCVLRRQAGRVPAQTYRRDARGLATDAAPAKIENPGGGTPGLSGGRARRKIGSSRNYLTASRNNRPG